jgi:hypothetical protein
MADEPNNNPLLEQFLGTSDLGRANELLRQLTAQPATPAPALDPSTLQQALGARANAQNAPVPPPQLGPQAQADPGTLSSLMLRSDPRTAAPMVQGGLPAQDPNASPTMAGRRPNIVNLISGLINPAHATAAGQRVPSRTDVFENFIGQFINSFSQGLQAAGHGPGANLRGLGAAIHAPYRQDVQEFQQRQQAQAEQAQVQSERARTAQTEAQTRMIGQTSTIMTPMGPMTVPTKDLGKVQGQLGAATIRAEGAQKVAELKEGVQFPLPVEMALQIGRMDLAGKMLGKSGWDSVNKALTAQGKNIQVGDIGNGHVGTFNKATGEILRDFGEGQRLKATEVGAQQRAYWAAKFGVTPVQDDTGRTYYVSRLDAPGMAPAAHAFDIVKGKAGLNNYKDALTRISDNLDVMNDTTQRALIARTLRSIGTVHDPGIIASALGNAVSSGLDPKAADLAAAMLQAREFIGANRQFAGNFQGSEALYQRMVSNVPGPMNSPALNRALIKQDLDNTARIESQLTKFQGGKAKTSSNATVDDLINDYKPGGKKRAQ